MFQHISALWIPRHCWQRMDGKFSTFRVPKTLLLGSAASPCTSMNSVSRNLDEIYSSIFLPADIRNTSLDCWHAVDSHVALECKVPRPSLFAQQPWWNIQFQLGMEWDWFPLHSERFISYPRNAFAPLNWAGWSYNCRFSWDELSKIQIWRKHGKTSRFQSSIIGKFMHGIICW